MKTGIYRVLAIGTVLMLIGGCGTMPAGKVGEVRLDTNIASQHFVEPGPLTGIEEFNEKNPGLGIEVQLSPGAYIAVGTWHNSYYERSNFVGFGAFFEGCDIGFEFGPVTGYEIEGDYFMLLPYYKYDFGPMAAKLYISTDPFDSGDSGQKLVDFVALQFQFKLGKVDI